MKGDCRGWYFELLVYYFYNGNIPNNFNDILKICRVEPYEMGRFEKSYEYLLKEKLKKTDNGLMPIDNVISKNTEQKGASHWNWKNGISTISSNIRASTEMKYWRKSVFYRDNYTCRHCQKKGVILNAHHIKPFAKYPELRFDVDNGLTLCKTCHIELHKKERDWK